MAQKDAKPGWKSTEFWLAALAMTGGFVLMIKGQVEAGTTLVGVGSAGYAASRGLAKLTR